MKTRVCLKYFVNDCSSTDKRSTSNFRDGQKLKRNKPAELYRYLGVVTDDLDLLDLSQLSMNNY